MTDYFKSSERNILFRRFEALTPERLSTDKSTTGHQLIRHLNKSLREICSDSPRPHQWYDLFMHTVGKWLIFHLLPWRESAPRTAECMTLFTDGNSNSGYAEDHAEFVRLLQEFEQKCTLGTLLPHPRFGRLSKSEWGQYLFLHCDYHLSKFNIHGDYRAPT
jgi:Protein of unknown function (DUF1569)